jgi:hypothetical protein
LVVFGVADLDSLEVFGVAGLNSLEVFGVAGLNNLEVWVLRFGQFKCFGCCGFGQFRSFRCCKFGLRSIRCCGFGQFRIEGFLLMMADRRNLILKRVVAQTTADVNLLQQCICSAVVWQQSDNENGLNSESTYKTNFISTSCNIYTAQHGT